MRATCVLALLLALVTTTAYRPNQRPFHNWHCLGCPDDDATDPSPAGNNATLSIFRQVHRALRQRGAARELYLLLDHAWIDRLLEPSATVVVKVVPRDRLRRTRLAQQEEKDRDKLDPVHGDAKYVVVYSPQPPPPSPPPPSPGDGTPPVRVHVLRKSEAVVVDAFLAANPCFLPLHDPPVTLNDSSLLQPLGPVSRRLSTDGDMHRALAETAAYEHAAIFVRLPSFPYHATCKLFNAVTAIQFRPRCPTAHETWTFDAYWLGNIGWVNNVYPLVTKLQSALHNDRLLVTPRAQENGGEQTRAKRLFYRSPMYKVKASAADAARRWAGQRAEVGTAGEWEALPDAPTKSAREEGDLGPGYDWAAPWLAAWASRGVRPVHGTWGAWADRHECPSQAHFAFDPWACHFIPLSHCNFVPELQSVVPTEGYADDPKNGSAYLTLLKGEIDADRRTYGDALQLKHLWEFSRLLTFLHRPNIFTRANLRNALATLAGVPAQKRWRKKTGKRPPALAAPGGAMDGPCVGIHIRHGDSINDRRGAEKVDRSLAAHTACAQRLMTDLGASTVFLATDNNTLFSLAPRVYPHTSWYHQARVLKDYSGANFDHRSSRSANREVANLLADMALITRCHGLVASYDGGLAHMFLLLACARRSTGACPANLDLWECQPAARINSTLYSFSTDPWLNV